MASLLRALILASPLLAAEAWARPLVDVTAHPRVQQMAARLGPLIRPNTPPRPEAPRPQVGGGAEILVFEDLDPGLDWSSPGDLEDAMLAVINGVYQARPDVDPEFIAVLTPFVVADPIAFYLSFSNEVEGVGWRHVRGEDSFDLAPAVALNGALFLNGLPAHQADPAEGRYTFLHEIGHRWGVYARVEDEDTPWIHLGRDCQHWSFFVDSGGSPLEGNVWVEEPPGIFTTDTGLADVGYNDFDRYFMGLLPAEAVAPLSVITGAGAFHCAFPTMEGARNLAWLPPAFNEQGPPTTVEGTRRTITLDEIIAAEGPRIPDVSTSRRDWRMIFVLAGRPGEITTSMIAEADALRRQWTADFEAETMGPEGGMILTTTLSGERPDAALPDQGVADAGPPDLDPPDQGVADADSPDLDPPDLDLGPPDPDPTAPRSGGCSTREAPPSWLIFSLLPAWIIRRRR